MIGRSSKLSFCQYRPCYVYDRTHVGNSDVAKYGIVYPKTINFFRYTSYEKVKAGIFDGPQIRKLKDLAFVSHMPVVESAAWCSYDSVAKQFLGKKRADYHQDTVKQILTNFQTLGAKMSIKLHLLFSHLGRFPDNLGGVSEEQGERFHQAIKTMETRYQGRWDRHMMSDCCWSFMRDSNQDNYKRKSYKRVFQQVD